MDWAKKIQDKWYKIYLDFCKKHFPQIKISNPNSRTAEIIWLLAGWKNTEEDILAILLQEFLTNLDIPKLKVVNWELFRMYEWEEFYFE
jgi:hypothetical protein